jgi:hypothetical protein
MLFILAVDVLQRMIQAASDLLSQPISHKLDETTMAF